MFLSLFLSSLQSQQWTVAVKTVRSRGGNIIVCISIENSFSFFPSMLLKINSGRRPIKKSKSGIMLMVFSSFLWAACENRGKNTSVCNVDEKNTAETFFSFSPWHVHWANDVFMFLSRRNNLGGKAKVWFHGDQNYKSNVYLHTYTTLADSNWYRSFIHFPLSKTKHSANYFLKEDDSNPYGKTESGRKKEKLVFRYKWSIRANQYARERERKRAPAMKDGYKPSFIQPEKGI